MEKVAPSWNKILSGLIWLHVYNKNSVTRALTVLRSFNTALSRFIIVSRSRADFFEIFTVFHNQKPNRPCQRLVHLSLTIELLSQGCFPLGPIYLGSTLFHSKELIKCELLHPQTYSRKELYGLLTTFSKSGMHQNWRGRPWIVYERVSVDTDLIAGSTFTMRMRVYSVWKTDYHIISVPVSILQKDFHPRDMFRYESKKSISH